MTCPAATTLPHLPEELAALGELALDLRWSWSHATDVLWERIDPALWALTHNPWLILQNTSGERLRALAADPVFMASLQALATDHQDMLASPAWFQTAYPQSALRHVAYFSMEFGLSESLPIYSGGLGILAGDFLKTASDLGVPVTGVGLLWQRGYFRQSLDEHGNQVEFFPHNDPAQLPVLPVYDQKGERLRVELPFPGRTLILRAWQVRVGRVSLYLLDSNDPLNTPADRGITAELYGGGSEMRLLQEICLGVGGWQLLRRVGIQPDVICCRSDAPVSQDLRDKIALFCDVDKRAVVPMVTSKVLYEVPLLLEQAGLKASAKWILFEGGDASGLDRSIPLSKALDDCLRGELREPAAAVVQSMPGTIGNQKLRPRNSRVAARADAIGTPVRCSMVTLTASNVPKPPGRKPSASPT